MTQQNKKRREEKKPVYAGSYEQALKESGEKLSSRPAFEYDMNEDGLYRRYKDSYTEAGRRAMRDSMGQAAALTGGYGSSYAQSLGQQKYDEHLGGLNELVPELYKLAWQRYLNEGEELEKEYDRLQRLRDEEYERYNDDLDSYESRERWNYEQEKDALEAEKAQEQQDYKRTLDKAEAMAKYGNFDGYAELYGEEAAERMREHWISANPESALQQGLIGLERYYALVGYGKAGSGSTSSNKKTYPGTAPDGRDARSVQQELRAMGYNIAVDGAWGPKSQAAWDKVYGKSGSFAAGSGSGGEYLFRV